MVALCAAGESWRQRSAVLARRPPRSAVPRAPRLARVAGHRTTLATSRALPGGGRQDRRSCRTPTRGSWASATGGPARGERQHGHHAREHLAERLREPGAATTARPTKSPRRRLRTIEAARARSASRSPPASSSASARPSKSGSSRCSRFASCTSGTATSRRSSSKTSAPSPPIPMRDEPDPSFDDCRRRWRSRACSWAR